MAIRFYKLKDPGGFLSNFYKHPIAIYGREWINVEAPYQSRKTLIPEEVEMIHDARTAKEARDIGQKVSLVPYWNDIKYDIMKECCFAKFYQNEDLLKMLLETGEEELIEASPYDSYWGTGRDGDGLNMLGKVLMEVRKSFQDMDIKT
jgi:hypothetical protein